MSKRKPLPTSPAQPVPVVAIGASAGGLEAVSVLLADLSPTTGFAYVYVQHLDPSHGSKLTEILGRVTTMPVLEAEHLQPIVPNHVYTIPAEHDLEIIDGVLTLLPRQKEISSRHEGQHLPVDRFFISLADRQKAGAIAIVLSGLDDDGTQGLKAIKAAGGITIAQDQSALYQGMPRSSIAEGVVDLVLSPVQIARELERLSQNSDIFRQTALAEEDENRTPDEELKPILAFLRKTVGVDFSHYKVTTIRRRIVRRMLLFKLENLKDYAQYIRQNPAEANLLYNDLLINVTSFFRDTEVMEYIKKVLLPRIINEKTEIEPLRIWVPACSTGQEAYSLAILLMEVLNDRASSMVIQIFATDLSESAITKARLGTYSRSEVLDVSPRRLSRYFTKQDDHYRINKSIRDLCVFAPHNIFRDPPFSRVDLVSCRNLLIYLNATLQRRALTMFHYGLNPKGFLLLGKSETVGNSTSLFTSIEKTYKIFARKNDSAQRASFELTPRTIEPKILPAVTQPVPVSRSATPPINDLELRVDAKLLSQYVPASVVVNQELDILSFRGATSLYLEHAQGRASLNLLKMARPSLSFELRNAVHKVFKSGKPYRKSGLEMKMGGATHYVTIEAAPLESDNEDRLFLIIFQEMEPPSLLENGPMKARNRRIKELEEELETVRRDMHSMIEEQEAGNEELQSANEEIVSSNEELQSINEELETSKEEIESTNEELLTINQELQVRNEQLSEAYEFAEAIFATLREATLVLDADLRVRSANLTFYEMFDIRREEAEGRLLYEMGGRQWDSPRFRERLAGVITQDTQLQGFEFTYVLPSGQEKFLLINARRVVLQQRKEAILLAIEEITQHRRAQRLSEEREAWFHAIADNSPALTWVAGVDGRYTYLNRAWLQYTGRSMDKEIGHGWAQGIHPEDRVRYLATYHANFADRIPFSTEYRLLRHDGQYRWMLENAQPTVSPEGSFSGYIGTCADVQLQKELSQELDRRVQQRTQELATANNLLNRTEITARIGSYEREFTSPKLTGSDELYRLFGYEPYSVDLSVDFIDQLTHPDDLPLINEQLGQAVQDGQPLEYIRRIIRPDGELRYLYNRHEIIHDQAGLPYKIVGFHQDITDRVLAQEKLRLTTENLQAVLDSSPTRIAFFKAVFSDEHPDQIVDFCLAVCNQKFADLQQKTAYELIDQSVTEMTDLLWQEKTFEQLSHIQQTGEPFYQDQHTPDQPVEWTAVSATRFDGGVMVTGLDITALKYAESQQDHWLEELRTSNESLQILEELRQQMRQRGQFLRETSHDLRGNIGVISGAASLLAMVSSDEERVQMVDMLQRNIGQATLMLTQMLDFARLEAGQEHLQLDTFDVAVLLRNLSEKMLPIAIEKELEVQTEGPDSLLIEGDALKIERIFQNLVLNAIKYTPQGHIRIQWQGSEEQWVLLVQDTGPGISTAIARQFRTASENAPDRPFEFPLTTHDGEGIGLSIVRQLCILLKAQLDIESVPDTGTTFRITWPRRYAPKTG
ncbi:hypothetical protein GCM10027299_58520 [Larkinella ripae]